MTGRIAMKHKLQSWQHAFADGLFLRGYRSRNPGKPVLHFLHGNGMNGLIYSPMLDGLEDDYEIFLSDIEGHGDSDTGPEFPGFIRTAEHCIEVCRPYRKNWQGRPIIGVGHSLGGLLTILMATAPEGLFDRLVLLDPTILPKRLMRTHQVLNWVGLSRHQQLAKNARRRQNHWSSRDHAYDYFSGRGMLKSWHPDAVDAYVEHALSEHSNGQFALKCPPEREATIFSCFPYNIWRAITRLRIPTHIIYGERSFSFLHKSLNFAARINPHISVQRVQGGHFFMLEDPTQAQQYLRDALARL